jgi:hypothetical protein
MLGMGLGMLLAQITRGHALSVWASFLSLTMFHMYGEYFFVLPCFLNIQTTFELTYLLSSYLTSKLL